MQNVPLPVCLDDYERLAERVLDANAWAYFAGGAADELTLRWNREAYTRWCIVPRVLRRPDRSHTRLTLAGMQLTHPIIVAPVAFQKLAHGDGEIATARGAAAQDSLMVLSTLASTPMEEVRDTGQACRWFQLYMQPSRDDTLRLVRRAEQAKFEAIVVTVDAPLNGVRNREQRAGFRLPAGIAAVNVPPPVQTKSPPADDASAIFTEFRRAAADWQDIGWLIANTSLPVFLKGIASPEDAEKSIEVGAAAIVVSNHGGRVLDTVPASLDLLTPIAERVGGHLPLLLDGGIRRGTDVLKALALGASAVMVGRPIVYGLAVAGAFGVSHVLRLLRDELEIAMALCGCATLDEIKPDLLTPRPA